MGFLGFWSLGAVAQEYMDLLTVSGRYAAPAPYDNAGGRATESVFLANARLPIVFSDKTIWFNNLTYTHSQVAQDPESGQVDAIRLHGFIFQTGLVQRIDDKRAFQFLAVPRYMTDGVNPGSDAWQFGAIALYEHRFKENLRLRFGLMANQEMSGPLLVPLVDVLWQMGPRWSISGLLPIYGKVKYQPSARFSTGLAYFGLITSYALSGPENAHTYMERTSIDFSLFGRLKVVGNFYAEGRLGYALDRNYEQYGKNESIDLRLSIVSFGDNRGGPRNATFADGPFAELRLVYSIPIPEDN